MDPSMGRPSPRRELQGPRPAPLKVNKKSRSIQKPPLAPPQPHAAARPPPPPPPPNNNNNHHRDPVIIYAVSPKVIHTNPGDFMSLVQRLTGSSTSDADPDPAAASSPSPSSSLPSPAARLASIERSVHPDRPVHVVDLGDSTADFDQTLIDRSSSFPGILSPIPSALPPISPSFFSPLPLDPSFLNILNELSPIFAATTTTTTTTNNNNNNNNTRSFAESSSFMAMASPNNNFLSSPMFLSPSTCWDLITQFDL